MQLRPTEATVIDLEVFRQQRQMSATSRQRKPGVKVTRTPASTYDQGAVFFAMMLER